MRKVLLLCALLPVLLEASDYSRYSGYAAVVPFAGGLIAVPWGYSDVHYLSGNSNARGFDFLGEDFRCGGLPSVMGDSLCLQIHRNGGDFIFLFTRDSLLEEWGPFEDAGRPVFDGGGNIWFTGDGRLYRNGIATAVQLQAHTISVDSGGENLVYCDSGDRVCLMRTESGVSEVIAQNQRYYSPFFTNFRGTETVISSSLQGNITLIDPETGAWEVIAVGTHPFWWSGRGVLLYSVTTDDGHSITSGEIRAVTESGEELHLTDTPDVHETMPAASEAGAFAIDAVTGSVVEVPRCFSSF